MILPKIAVKSRLNLSLSIIFTVTAPLSLADGKTLVNGSCSDCHLVDLPKASPTLQDKINRRAPPLHFAGHKYQEQWLTQWLQTPSRITPTGGGYWADTVEVTDEGDEIDESKLSQHQALSSAEAKQAAQYLMSLKPFPDLIRAGEYKPAKVIKSLARKNFRKFKGCASCHRDEVDFGGVSAPELHDAMNRLQPEYIASVIRNPGAWDAKTLMPNKTLKDPAIYKLMNYLTSITDKK